MADPRAGRVCYGRCLGNADPEDPSSGACRTRTHTDEHADRARAHQVQSGRVRGTASDYHRDLVGRDELLEVQWLGARGHVLRRHDSALDHENIELSLESDLVELLDALRSQGCRSVNAPVLDLADALEDELLFNRLLVDLLQIGRAH